MSQGLQQDERSRKAYAQGAGGVGAKPLHELQGTTGAQGEIVSDRRGGLVCRPVTRPLIAAPSASKATGHACGGCGGIHASLGLVEEKLTVTGGDAGGISPEEWALRDHLLTEHRRMREEHHRTKADAARVERDHSLAEWHQSRAGTLTRKWTDRQAACMKEQVIRAWCDGCGEVHERMVGCSQRAWCDACGMKAARESRRKILVGIGEAYKAEMREWAKRRRAGTRPSVRLLTLSVRHTGDLKRDREVITKAWVRFRAWIQKRQGSRPFVLTWEVTDGVQGAHVHAHVVMVGPFLPVQEAAREWVLATREGAEAQGFDMKVSTSERAASYAAKYATKGCDPRSVSRDTWLDWFQASAGKRSYSASRGLFAPVDVVASPPCCRESGAQWGGVAIVKLSRYGGASGLDDDPERAERIHGKEEQAQRDC